MPQEGVTALGAPGEEPWSRKDGHQSDGPELSRPLLGSIHLPSGTEYEACGSKGPKHTGPCRKAMYSAGGSHGSPQTSG